jgi:hypothetical protein
MAQMIQGAVARGLHEVRRHGAAVRQAVLSTPELQEDVLREFLGHPLIAENAMRHTDDRLVPLTEERVKGVMVTGTKAGQEIGVGHVGAESERYAARAVRASGC